MSEKFFEDAMEKHKSECFYGALSCAFCRDARNALALLEAK